MKLCRIVAASMSADISGQAVYVVENPTTAASKLGIEQEFSAFRPSISSGQLLKI